MSLDDTPCLRAWPRLAAHSGRDPDQRPRPLRRGGDVVRMGDVVLKHVPSGFGRTVRAHRQAFRALRDDPLNRAPRFLGFDEAEQVILLAFCPGTPMRDAVAEGGDPAHLAGLAGRWLGAFHRARETDAAPFDAAAAVRRIASDAAFLPRAFARARSELVDRGAALQDSPQPRAVLHGDLNASNLLVTGEVLTGEVLTGEVVTGIDFDNLHLHPAMRDAGQVLAELHLRAAEPPNRVLPPHWQAAFERSYGAGGEMLEFFVLQRLLRQWATIPARAADRGAAREAMARGVAEIFG